MPPESLKSEMERLPDRGIYLLLIENSENFEIEVGALGMIEFREGYYVYVGSAQRNMKKRVERHLRKDKKLKWHIDYLLKYARVVDFFGVEAEKEWEEKLALRFSELYPHIPGFGSSDSRAPSHLFMVSRADWENMKRELKGVK